MTIQVEQKTTSPWPRRMFATLALLPLVYNCVTALSGLSTSLILSSGALGLAFLLTIARLNDTLELLRIGTLAVPA